MSNVIRSFDNEDKEDSLIRELTDMMKPKQNHQRFGSHELIKKAKPKTHARKRSTRNFRSNPGSPEPKMPKVSSCRVIGIRQIRTPTNFMERLKIKKKLSNK